MNRSQTYREKGKQNGEDGKRHRPERGGYGIAATYIAIGKITSLFSRELATNPDIKIYS
jgi:hypothetical protein